MSAMADWVVPPLPARGPGCPPALELERMAAGELPMAGHVDDCGECSRFIGALRAEAEEFLRARPPEGFLAQLAQARRPRRSGWRFLLLATPVLAAASLAVFVLQPSPAEVRLKGGRLKAAVQRAGQGEPRFLQSGEALQPGDALRFVYDAPADGFVAVIDVEEGAAPVVFVPYGATEALPVREGRSVLPGTVALDASRGQGRLVVLFSRRSFPLATVAAAAGQSDQEAVRACGDCQVESLPFRKP